MIVLIDNYDSFVYNLARYVGELGFERTVIRNDASTVDALAKLHPQRIIISPGPGTPEQAGISIDVIKEYAGKVPILGVCLGHQAIGAAFGGQVVRAQKPMHGKSSAITHTGAGVFADLPMPLTVGRYHSLIVSEENLPDTLEITARSEENEIMGLQHRELPVYGVQFHPESVLTEEGYRLLKNFMEQK